jgi:hypothetical protein
MTQEGLVWHKGKDIGEQVDSWVLQDAPHSTQVGLYAYELIYRMLVLVSYAHNGGSYTCKTVSIRPMVTT